MILAEIIVAEMLFECWNENQPFLSLMLLSLF
jgi:hypothetical protein